MIAAIGDLNEQPIEERPDLAEIDCHWFPDLGGCAGRGLRHFIGAQWRKNLVPTWDWPQPKMTRYKH